MSPGDYRPMKGDAPSPDVAGGKKDADKLNIPKPVSKPSGTGVPSFASLKAYTTRAKRSVFSS